MPEGGCVEEEKGKKTNWLGRNEEVSGIGRLRRGKGKREGSEMGSKRRSIGRALMLVLVCSARGLQPTHLRVVPRSPESGGPGA